MKLMKEYNLIENKKLVFWLNIAAIPLFLLFTVIFTFISWLFFGEDDLGYTLSINNGKNAILTFLLYFVLIFVIILIHELIHGLFFKLLNPEAKVRFGFKNGTAYATSPNSYYRKKNFIIICLAPFVLISGGLLLSSSLGIISKAAFIFYGSLHASSCIGDFYWIYLLSSFKGNIYVEDTENGMNVYLKE